MTLGTPYAAECSKRVSIYAGRTCGFAAEISVGLTEPERGSGRLSLLPARRSCVKATRRAYPTHTSDRSV